MKKIYQANGEYKIEIEASDAALLTYIGGKPRMVKGSYTDATAASLNAHITAALASAVEVPYVAPPVPTQEELWGQIRAERDRLLTTCDWTQLSDAPLGVSTVTEWATYRQELRDLPQAYASPEEVIWPTAPGI